MLNKPYWLNLVTRILATVTEEEVVLEEEVVVGTIEEEVAMLLEVEEVRIMLKINLISRREAGAEATIEVVAMVEEEVVGKGLINRTSNVIIVIGRDTLQMSVMRRRIPKVMRQILPKVMMKKMS